MDLVGLSPARMANCFASLEPSACVLRFLARLGKLTLLASGQMVFAFIVLFYNVT